MTFFRWVPLTFILVVAGGLVVMLLSGGLIKIAAWYLIQLILPVTGLIGLIFSIICLILQKHLGGLTLVTGVLSLLAILPALMLAFPIPYPASIANTFPPVTVRLPANGPLKVAWGGDTLNVNYHVITPDQRWAYDFLVEPYLTGSSTLTDYGCFGLPVVAPVSGLVHLAQDGEPDMVPGKSSNNFDSPSGNHVIIKLDETGTYLVIAHFKQGSLVVKTGQRVEEGQVIGQCGNSGNTSEPHIHIHHQRQDPLQYPVNFAEGLPLYFRDHNGPPMPEGGVEEINGKIVATGAIVINQK
jgi:hypothetical protein